MRSEPGPLRTLPTLLAPAMALCLADAVGAAAATTSVPANPCTPNGPVLAFAKAVAGQL